MVEDGALRKVEVPDGPNRLDFKVKNHYHVRSIKCSENFDLDKDEAEDQDEQIMGILNYLTEWVVHQILYVDGQIPKG